MAVAKKRAFQKVIYTRCDARDHALYMYEFQSKWLFEVHVLTTSWLTIFYLKILKYIYSEFIIHSII